ncbi:MAG: hypothetical protein H0X35_00135, partial [Pseudonocardiales bacterium]|nr:hypothetical protein [Pseudonocardiales bacterium]
MADRIVKFSDLSNSMIEPGSPYARIVIEQHSELAPGRKVTLDCLPEELKGVDNLEIDMVVFTVYEDGKDPRKVTMQREDFDAIAHGDDDMPTLIANGMEAQPPAGRTRAPSKRVDYASVEHAGRPHRGVTTDAEKEIVRQNLGAINERLTREGHRIIDPTDEAM